MNVIQIPPIAANGHDDSSLLAVRAVRRTESLAPLAVAAAIVAVLVAFTALSHL